MAGFGCMLLALAVVCAGHRPPYFGFYMDSNATSHTAGANLYLASTPALAVRALAGGGMVSLLKVDSTFLQRNPLDPTNRKNMTLRPDWRTQWTALLPVARELLSNGTMLGFDLGDELVDKCVRFEWIALMASTVKQAFPAAVVWYNEGVPMLTAPKACSLPPKFPNGTATYVVPREVDWFSVDLYHPLKHIAPQPGWVGSQVRTFYRQHVYPLLNFSAGQRAALVPGSFGSKVNGGCDATCYRRMIAMDAADYFEWAAEEPERVAAILPWHWGGCEGNEDCVAHLDERRKQHQAAYNNRLGEPLLTGRDSESADELELSASSSGAWIDAVDDGAPVVLILGQRGADVDSIRRAFARDTPIVDRTLPDDELIHPDKHLAGEEWRQLLERAALIVFAFDCSGERVAVLGLHGCLQPLWEMLTSQLVAFIGGTATRKWPFARTRGTDQAAGMGRRPVVFVGTGERSSLPNATALYPLQGARNRMGEAQLKDIEAKVAWNEEIGLPADACAPLIMWNQDASNVHKTSLSRMRQGVMRATEEETEEVQHAIDTAADDAVPPAWEGDSSMELEKKEDEAIMNMYANQAALAAKAKESAKSGRSGSDSDRGHSRRKQRLQFD